jgi:CRP/FNR family transcriptional regulator
LSDRKDIHNSDVPIVCRSCEARHKGLCGALNPTELATLAKYTHVERFASGRELIGEGAEIETYGSVMRGVVKLTKGLADGRRQVVGLQFAPDFVGRLFAEESQVTAEAASDVDLCTLPKAALEKLVADNPGMERRLLMQTLRELDEARDWMMTLGQKTAPEKVASFLYLIASHIDPAASAASKAASFDLPLTRADIADFLGLTIETVSRQLTQLRKDRVIEIQNYRHIVVPDLRRLQARCG